MVCCTGGEEGDVLNPEMDTEEVRRRLPEIRLEELERSASIIGYSEVVMLGYRDSGMPGSDANRHPDAFVNVPLEEAVARLVGEIRRIRPHVVITYADDQSAYPHPDHIKVHEVSVPAFDLAGDDEWRPELGPAWRPLKLYYTVWSRQRIRAMHDKFMELGLTSPFSDEWLNRPSLDHRVTTRVYVGDFLEVRYRALRAHATQVDPNSAFWFGLPPEAARDAYPYEDYILAKSLVETHVPEDDLFEGIRVGSWDQIV